MDTPGAPASTRARCSRRSRQSLAKLYFDTIVFDRSSSPSGEPLGRRPHRRGTDYPYDMGSYDPRGFVDGCTFLKDADARKFWG